VTITVKNNKSLLEQIRDGLAAANASIDFARLRFNFRYNKATAHAEEELIRLVAADSDSPVKMTVEGSRCSI
jgi:hypothetical protein